MKKLFLCLGLIYGLNSTARTQQVIDISTGVVGTSLAAYGVNEDTWTSVSTPNVGTVTPRVCRNLGGLWAEPGCARWITSSIDMFAQPKAVWNGSYVYQMTFNANAGCVSTATLNFNFIGGDDQIAYIKVNGNNHPINSYGFNPPASSITIPLTGTANSEINPGALNTIEVGVSNVGGQQSGLYICGNLTITYGAVTPTITTTATSFCQGAPLTFTSSVVGAAQSHFWEIAECDQFGNVTPGGFVWNNGFAFYPGNPGTYTFPSSLSLACNKYYKIKLAALNQCSPWVEANKVIRMDCSPTSLAGLDQTVCPGQPITIGEGGTKGRIFSWSPNTWLSNSADVAPTVTIPAGFTSPCPGEITYTKTTTLLATGCSSTDQVTVSYATAPSVASITHQTHGMCDYTIDVNANTGCSSGIRYTWNTAPAATLGASIQVTPSVPMTYTLETFNGCFFNYQTHTVYPCYHPTGSYPTLSYDNAVYVNWSGNYPQDGLWVFDANYAPGVGPAYGADHLTLRVYDRWGTSIIYTQNEDAPCGGFWNGLLTYNCVYGGQPLQQGVYNFEVISSRCGGQIDTKYASFTVIGTRTMADGHEGVQVADVHFAESKEALDEMNRAASKKLEANDIDLSVYPNPGTGVFTLELDGTAKASIEVYDALGKKVGAFEQTGFKSIIDLSASPKGVYMLNVISEGKKVSKKIILE